jgi:hypothetical protein
MYFFVLYSSLHCPKKLRSHYMFMKTVQGLQNIPYLKRSRYSSVGAVAKLRVERSGFDSQQGLRIFLFITMSKPALEPTQSPIQLVPGALSLRVKRPELKADHLPPPSAEVKNAWSYISTPQYAFMAWCLIKHRD